MLTLHDASQLTKSIAKWIGIVVGGIIIIILLVRGGMFIKNTFFPTPPPPPEVAFGKLPKISFPESISSEKFSYEIDTVTGNLGTFADRAYVYQTVTPVPTLLDLKNARDDITSTSFSTNETYITDTVYSWRDSARPDKKITLNIVSRDFSIVSNYLTYPDVKAEGPARETQATTSSTAFLETLDLFPLDLDEAKTQTQLLTLQGTELYAATSLSTAELIRVDYFQKDIDKLPIMYPHPPYSTIHFLMGGPQTTEILEGSFFHQTISDQRTTYPIISIDTAYTLLKENKAYIASYYGTSPTVAIKNIYLAYFVGEEKQDYMQPIYVFEGKDGFFAYVPAVMPEWVNE